MSENGFYLTLPSNASFDLHPDNTLTHYITTLPQRISLSGQWECGMVEIQYPHTWYNVRKENSWLHISRTDAHGISAQCNIEAGHYDSPERLIREMNRVLSHRIMVTKTVKLSYSDISQKVTVRMTPDTVFITGVIHMLGFHADGMTSPSGGYTTMERNSTSVIDMAQGFYSLYVYTKVVESRVVGHSVVPLLRIVPIEGKNSIVSSGMQYNFEGSPELACASHGVYLGILRTALARQLTGHLAKIRLPS